MREQQRIAVCPIGRIPVPHVFDILVFSSETGDLAGLGVDLQDGNVVFQRVDHTKNSELLHYFSHGGTFDAGSVAFIGIDMHSQSEIISDSYDSVAEYQASAFA